MPWTQVGRAKNGGRVTQSRMVRGGRMMAREKCWVVDNEARQWSLPSRCDVGREVSEDAGYEGKGKAVADKKKWRRMRMEEKV